MNSPNTLVTAISYLILLIRRSIWLMRALPKPLRFLLRHCLPHIFPNDNLLSCPYLPSIYSRRRGVLIVPIRLKANSVGVRVPSAVVRARASCRLVETLD